MPPTGLMSVSQEEILEKAEQAHNKPVELAAPNKQLPARTLPLVSTSKRRLRRFTSYGEMDARALVSEACSSCLGMVLSSAHIVLCSPQVDAERNIESAIVKVGNVYLCVAVCSH